MDEDRADDKAQRIASEIANAIRSAAVMAVSTPGWGRALTLSPGVFENDKSAQQLNIGLLPFRPAVPNELVVVDFNLDRGVAPPLGFGEIICKQLGPFIVGVGKVSAHVTPKGIVLLLAEDGQQKMGHQGSSPSEGRAESQL